MLIPLFLTLSAFATTSDGYVSRLRDVYHYKCTDNTHHDGTFCVGNTNGPTYVLIPDGLTTHARNVFYAHGDTGVCGNGASGENYLKDQMPALKRNNAIAVLPFRKADRNLAFPFASFIATFDKMLGDNPLLPWDMAGHSWGGKFLVRELNEAPSIAARVNQILLLDTGYDVADYNPHWETLLRNHPNIKIRAVASTTLAGTRKMMAAVNAVKPGAMHITEEKDEHCAMPRYFSLY